VGQWAHPRTRTASPRRRAQTTNANTTSAHAPNARVCRGRAREIIVSTAKTARRRRPRRDSHRTGTRRTSRAMPHNGQSGRWVRRRVHSKGGAVGADEVTHAGRRTRRHTRRP
jgi:hypothetical protein